MTDTEYVEMLARYVRAARGKPGLYKDLSWACLTYGDHLRGLLSAPRGTEAYGERYHAVLEATKTWHQTLHPERGLT